MMNDIEAILGMLFRVALVMNLCSIIALLLRDHVKYILVIPWAATAIGLCYFAIAECYFRQPEIALSVPIRVDIVFLAPLLLLSLLGVGVSLKKRNFRQKNEEKETQPLD